MKNSHQVFRRLDAVYLEGGNIGPITHDRGPPKAPWHTNDASDTGDEVNLTTHIYREGEAMQLRDVMTRNVEITQPDATVQEAAVKMKALNIGALPVCDGDRLVGLLTDRDITVRATAEGRNPANTAISEVMTPDIAYCFDDQRIGEAARVMAEKQIRRMPVLDRNKRLVGIISLGSLAVHTKDDNLAGDVLKQVSKPASPER